VDAPSPGWCSRKSSSPCFVAGRLARRPGGHLARWHPTAALHTSRPHLVGRRRADRPLRPWVWCASDESRSVLVMMGPGGMGKTRLALQAAAGWEAAADPMLLNAPVADVPDADLVGAAVPFFAGVLGVEPSAGVVFDLPGGRVPVPVNRRGTHLQPEARRPAPAAAMTADGLSGGFREAAGEIHCRSGTTGWPGSRLEPVRSIMCRVAFRCGQDRCAGPRSVPWMPD
jgi:hypothetical protein